MACFCDFLKWVFFIAKSVKVSIQEQLSKHEHDTFEIYIYALWKCLMKICSTLKIEHIKKLLNYKYKDVSK